MQDDQEIIENTEDRLFVTQQLEMLSFKKDSEDILDFISISVEER